ncbi:retinitis pigmentosa 1-like 1 protein [Pipistrellus kuhlii]|uniref:RP1 like 1 n=1 Tax=Pipistrellus kuhlii TaxID=59472 RepID=A0A7J7XC70_PIPKU|nr:retinitis pigmentosa 1-like 1 protein [Pipistrellus kuhlii]KAF6347319.1 RP1 like 1 [Pipistrellus kuhlii]
MNSTPRDAQAPTYRECLLPSVARTPSVTQVTPAKKITFLKRGDPRFSGVRLAVHQRTFKSLGTLMDELSQRVPLSFGVRYVTTPGGLHDLSALEQLEDGGCYLCSDRKQPKTFSGPGQPWGRSPSAQQTQDVEDQCEGPGTSSSRKNPKTPRRITLVKNGDPRFQQTVVLSHRDTRSLSAFLSRAAGLLHFPVKQVYTPSGEKVGSLKALLRSPSVLVCAGHEPFRPLEGAKRSGTGTLLGQTSRNKNGSCGPKAKPSMTHSRSRLGSRPQRSTLPPERADLGDLLVSPHHTRMGPAPDGHPQDMPAQLGPLVAGDGVEKKVHLNEDGSLSVEMKVRFHLLGNNMLLWSRRAGRTSGQGPIPREADPLHCVWEGHPGGSSEPGTQGLGTRKAGCTEAFERGQWQPGSGYEIWTNPLYTAQREGTASWRRSRQAQRSPCRGPWSPGVADRKRSSKDSSSPASSDRAPEVSEPNSCCSWSPEGNRGSCALYLASRAAPQRGPGWGAGGTSQAAEGPAPEGAGLGSTGHRCLEPRTHGAAGAFSDPSASAHTQEEPSERGEQQQGHASKTRLVTSPRKATPVAGPCSSTANPSSLRNEDSRAEGSEQDSGPLQPRGGSGRRPPLALGHLGSEDPAEGCFLASTCASATGRREQESRASAVSSPGISGLGRGAEGGRPRQHHGRRHTHCLLDSPVTRPALGPPSTGRLCPAQPAPRFSRSSSRARNPASRDPGPPSLTSPHSQDARGVSSAPVTPVSSSECASNVYPPFSPSAETEFRSHLLSTASDPLSSVGGGLGGKAGAVPKASWPLSLPVGQHEGGKSGAHQGGSQMGTPLACRAPGGETQALLAPQPQGSQGLLSEACLMCRGYCPTPPRAPPPVRKHSSCSSNRDHGAPWGPEGPEQGEEPLDVQCPGHPGSQSGATGTAVRAARRGSPSLGPRPGRRFQAQVSGGGEGLEEQEDSGRLMPGALPRASPEAVVCGWLSNIPEEPVPLSYEMVDDSMEVAGDGPEGPMEGPVDTHPHEGLEEPIQARRPSLEGAASKKAGPEGALLVASEAGPQSGEGLPPSRAAEAPEEAGAGEGVTGDRGGGQCVLPRGVSVSIQIMKALMGSKQGRPSSLPEVSGPEGRRLSRSVRALITCLARLHFFHEDRGSPAGKARVTDSSGYQELLSTLQASWLGCGLGRGELPPGSQGCGRSQALAGLGPHAVTEDFTPTSSSGVDVGSGSGGSGEGSGPGAMDHALVSVRGELPSEVPCQRPDSRTSENPEDPGNHEPVGSVASSSPHAWAGATRRKEAGGSIGEQARGRDLDQVVENRMQGEAVQLDETQEEKERAEPHGEGVRGFLEEERTTGEDLPGAGSRDGAGAREDESVQEEEAGGESASPVLHPPGRGERTLGSLTERDSDASGSQSSPNAEPGLETLPRAADSDHEQSQAKFTQGAVEKGTSVAHRVSPDPDPLWVAQLLRKMEKAFLAHLASATAELRARWSLQDHDLLDQMEAELQQDVSQRLQSSTAKELRKIQSRAGRKAPGPPRVALRWETSLQTEQRRSRLQGLRNLSAFSEQTRALGAPSLSLDYVPNLSGALGTRLGGEASREEFCPCEACVRKEVALVSPKDTVDIARAPIKEAFDLQLILQKKKAGSANEETAGTDPETGMKLLQKDPSGIGTVQRADGGPELGLGRGPGAEEGDEDVGRGESTGGEEDAAAQKKGGNTDSCGGHPLEAMGWEGQEVGDQGENREGGFGAEVSVQSEAWGSPAGQNDTREVRDAEGEGQTELGRGDLGEKKGGPQAGPRQGLSDEASRHSSPDQDGGSSPPPASGGDTSGLRSGWKTSLFSSRASSLGNCSQLSQKGSEEGPSNGDMSTFGDEPKGVPSPERTAQTSLQKPPLPLCPSGSGTPERGTNKGLTPEPRATQGSDLGAEKRVKSLSGTEIRSGNLAMGRTHGFGQEDLNF